MRKRQGRSHFHWLPLQFMLDFLGAQRADGPISIELKDEQSRGQMRPPRRTKYRYRYIIMPYAHLIPREQHKHSFNLGSEGALLLVTPTVIVLRQEHLVCSINYVSARDRNGSLSRHSQLVENRGGSYKIHGDHFVGSR